MRSEGYTSAGKFSTMPVEEGLSATSLRNEGRTAEDEPAAVTRTSTPPNCFLTAAKAAWTAASSATLTPSPRASTSPFLTSPCCSAERKKRSGRGLQHPNQTSDSRTRGVSAPNHSVNSLAARSASAWLRSMMTTFEHPLSTNVRANMLPNPRAAPVTTQTLPSNDRVWRVRLLWRFSLTLTGDGPK
jgi:hypothetical protein